MGTSRGRSEEMSSRILADAAGAFLVALAYLGDKLGLFKALSASGPLAAAELARITRLDPRYVEGWLKAMVAGEYLQFDDRNGKYFMTEEEALALADEGGALFLCGEFQAIVPSIWNTSKLMEAFRKGGGISHSGLGTEILEGMDRLARTVYSHGLIEKWIARVPGLTQKLAAGGKILDVGCGSGRSTVSMARAFPRASVVGVDPDPHGIERAWKLAAESGAANARFVKLAVYEMPVEDRYDLVCAFDCIHDMSDPGRALRTIRSILKERGVFLWSEPNVSDNPLKNRHVAGKLTAGVNLFYCLPTSMSNNGRGTGNQLGEKALRGMAREAGFSTVQTVEIRNAFNRLFVARR